MRTPLGSRLIVAAVSGGVALLAQVAWVRLLAHQWGTSGQVSAWVLVIVLSGLAIGAGIFGRWADSVKNPMRCACLLLVASGLAMGMGDYFLRAIVRGGWDGARWGSLLGVDTAWLAVSCGVIFPPMFLIGGILPFLVLASPGSRESPRSCVGLLYGMEAIGGALGSVLAGFLVIRWYGLHNAIGLGAASAIIVGGVLAIVARRSALPSTEPVTPPDDRRSAWMPGERWLLAAACSAGFAAMGFEIVWLRLLLLLLSSDTYAYASVAACMLFGLATGAFLARFRLVRTVEPTRCFAWLQISVAVVSLLLVGWFGWLSGGPGQRWLMSLDGSWFAVLGGRFAICFGMLIVPTTLLGMGFPVLAETWLASRRHMGRRIGQLYATVVVGNVAGVLVTVAVLIPVWGLQRALAVLAVLHLVSAGLAMVANHRLAEASERPTVARRILFARGLAVAMILGIGGVVLWLKFGEPLSLGRSSDVEMLYYREGPVATVAVSRQPNGEKVMSVDGVIIGQSHGGVDQKQQMLVHLPFLLRPDQRLDTILTIGLGTGIVAGELARQEGVRQVDCVEVSPSVIEAAQQFQDTNHNVHETRKVRIILGDGVRFLRRNATMYDAIVCDGKSRPGHVGNGTFFSEEYYGVCRKRLRPNGLHVQWVSLETPPRALRVILRTMMKSFSYCQIGVAPPDSLYLVGSNAPLPLDDSAIARHLKTPQADRLRRYGWQNACDIVTLFAAREECLLSDTATSVTTPEVYHSLANPVLEFAASDLFSTDAADRKSANLHWLLAWQQRSMEPAIPEGDSLDRERTCEQPALELLTTSLAIIEKKSGWRSQAMVHVRRGLKVEPQQTQLRFIAWSLHLDLATHAEQQGQSVRALEYYRLAVQFNPDDLTTHRMLARRLQLAGDQHLAMRHYYEALRLGPSDVALRLEFAFGLAMLDRWGHAADQFRRVLVRDPGNARAHLGLGMMLLEQGDLSQARDHLRKAVALDASLDEAVAQLGI